MAVCFLFFPPRHLYSLLEEARMLRTMKRLVMVSPAKAGQW